MPTSMAPVVSSQQSSELSPNVEEEFDRLFGRLEDMRSDQSAEWLTDVNSTDPPLPMLLRLILAATAALLSALHHWHKALQIAEEIEDVDNQIDLVNKLGALFEQHGEHHRAIGCLNKLLQIHHEQGDKDAELAVLGSLASISYETEDYEMAVRHYEEILEKAIELEDRELQGKVYSNLGTAHQELENVEEAQKFYQQSLEIALEVHTRP